MIIAVLFGLLIGFVALGLFFAVFASLVDGLSRSAAPEGAWRDAFRELGDALGITKFIPSENGLRIIILVGMSFVALYVLSQG